MLHDGAGASNIFVRARSLYSTIMGRVETLFSPAQFFLGVVLLVFVLKFFRRLVVDGLSTRAANEAGVSVCH